MQIHMSFLSCRGGTVPVPEPPKPFRKPAFRISKAEGANKAMQRIRLNIPGKSSTPVLQGKQTVPRHNLYFSTAGPRGKLRPAKDGRGREQLQNIRAGQKTGHVVLPWQSVILS